MMKANLRMIIWKGKLIHTLLLWMMFVTVAGWTDESKGSREEHMQNNDVVNTAKEPLRQYSGPTVHNFARHGLCRHRFGKVRFFKALGKYFLNISDDMKITFILDICKRRDHMLTKWVEELFDIDGDGYITHFEKDIYR
ncbi:hypothetical protein MAR_035711 [Mya arenaria]|uniref:Uncharacterized protein n=1 Tax=Mya arenaria TaxID=6604 RepID=A0ABY7ELC8_MYAAR|nr:uncharacterized protein LOC128241683 [Mya arenaria]WAR10635.1 hypothetical protein MAR_035711 [Mya arenaria]